MKNKQKPRLAGRGSGNEFERRISSDNYNRNRIPIYRSDGVVIGYIDGDTFFKNVKASKHMLRKPPAWALDEDIYYQLLQYNITYFENRDKETGIAYKCTIKIFGEKSFLIDRRFGKQLALPLKYWQKGSPGERLVQQLSLGI